MNNRLKNLQKKIRAAKADAYWCVHEANRRYLSGFTGSNGWLVVPVQGKPVIITDGRYSLQVRQESPGWTVIDEPGDMVKLLTEVLQRHQIKKLLIEDDTLSLALWQRLKKRLSRLQGLSADGKVEELRLTKDQDEMKHLRKAVQIAGLAYKKVLPKIKAGMMEIELARLIENTMFALGGESLAFPTIVASGQNSALPHAKPTKKRLKKGDLVILDFGCTYKGYHSDLTRTIGIARMTGKQQEIYKIVKKAQVSAQKCLKSGQLVADSDKKAREVFKTEDIEQYFVHSLGHGLGLEIHEGPRLSKIANERLGSGMVVTCEPGIYIPGWGGIRIEDDVVITDLGPEWISKSPKTLPVVDCQ